MNCWIITSIRLAARGGLRASGIQNLLTAIALAQAGHRVVLWVAALESGGREAAEQFLGQTFPAGLSLLRYRPRGAAGEKKTPFAPGLARWVNGLRARAAGPAPDFILSRSPRALDQLRHWNALPAATRLILEYQYPEWALLWRGWRRRNPQAGARACIERLGRLRAQEHAWLAAADGVLYAAQAHTRLLERAAFDAPAAPLPSACLPPEALATQLENGTFDLGYAGGFEPENGIELLLKALVRLPGVSLKIIGGGGEREMLLRELAHDLGLAERIVWTGRIPFAHVRGAMRTCRVGVAPFRAGGGPEKRLYASPLKVIEWIGAGVPIAAAGVPSVTRLPGIEGCVALFPPDDVDAMAATLSRLLADASACARLRKAGFALAQEHAYPQRAARIVDMAEQLIRIKDRSG